MATLEMWILFYLASSGENNGYQCRIRLNMDLTQLILVWESKFMNSELSDSASIKQRAKSYFCSQVDNLMGGYCKQAIIYLILILVSSHGFLMSYSPVTWLLFENDSFYLQHPVLMNEDASEYLMLLSWKLQIIVSIVYFMCYIFTVKGILDFFISESKGNTLSSLIAESLLDLRDIARASSRAS